MAWLPCNRKEVLFPAKPPEQTAAWTWLKLLFLQLCDSSEVKKGNPCPLNRGCRLKKEGQLKVSKYESWWHELCKEKKESREKVKMALQALIACRGSWKLPWKPMIIIKNIIRWQGFGADFDTVQSAKFQDAHRSRLFLLKFQSLLHLYKIKNVSLLCSSRPSKQKTTVSLSLYCC